MGRFDQTTFDFTKKNRELIAVSRALELAATFRSNFTTVVAALHRSDKIVILRANVKRIK